MARLFLCVLICLMLLPATRQSWSLELQEILDHTMITPPARIAFREERHNKMLKEALVLTGYLEYLDEGRLRKVVETPFQEAFLIEVDRIVIERDGKTRTLPISKSRSLRTMLGGIEAILAGQTERLLQAFSYELDGTDSAWSLVLKPLSRRIARQLNALVVTGNYGSVTSIRFDLKDGEWHLMEILGSEY